MRMPVNTTNNFGNNFAEILPDHPHRRMHILLSILAFVLVVGSVVVYQRYRVKVVVQERDEGELKAEKLAEVSNSLTAQEQTPEFKRKLEEISKSLNRK